MLAALKFFLGQDVVAEEAAEDDTNADDNTFDCPSKDDVYRAYHKVLFSFRCYSCACSDAK